MSATLTVDALLAIAATFPPPLRVIVGFPLVPRDAAYKHERENLLLLGRSVWEVLRRNAPTTQAEWSISPFVTDAFNGVRVEFFGDHDDHEKILRRIAPEFIDAVLTATNGVIQP